MKWFGYRTLKSSIGAVVAILIASFIGLSSVSSAGIITILSVQNTKKQSFLIAYKRMIATIIALIIATILFIIFGFNPIVFGLFLLIFIPLADRLNVKEGIIVGSVLVTHLLSAKQIDVSLLLNEIVLMIIGVGVALAFNLYFPNLQPRLVEDQKFIDAKIKAILLEMSKLLESRNRTIIIDGLLDEVESYLHKSHRTAYQHMSNYFFSTEDYYLDFIEMRIRQYEVLLHLRKHLNNLFESVEQTTVIAKFTQRISIEFDTNNDGSDLLIEISDIIDNFKTMPLPITREEFENRAMLYQFINDLKDFILIKYKFMNRRYK